MEKIKDKILKTQKIIAKNIKRERLNRNLTQTEVAKKLGVTHSYISAMETGRRGSTVKFVIGISEFFNIPIKDLFTEKNN